MHIVPHSGAVPYAPPGHHDVDARRLQQRDGLSVGISRYAPGASVDPAPTAADTVYLVLGGALVLISHDDRRTVTLGLYDSAHVPAGEVRSLRNDSGVEATLLVVLSQEAK